MADAPKHANEAPATLTFGAGGMETVATPVPEQPPESETVTVKLPFVDGEMVAVVAPFDHKYVAKPAPALSVIEPKHAYGWTVTLGCSEFPTETACVAVPVQPLEFETVTLNVPFCEAKIVGVVAPVLQWISE